MSAERWLETVGAVADLARENQALRIRIGLLERTILLLQEEIGAVTLRGDNGCHGVSVSAPQSSDRSPP